MMPENGARISVLASLRFGELQRRLRNLEVFSASSLACPEMKLLIGEVDRAVVLATWRASCWPRLLDLGLVDRRVELDQQRALGDALALVERDRADAPGDFGTQASPIRRSAGCRPR